MPEFDACKTALPKRRLKIADKLCSKRVQTGMHFRNQLQGGPGIIPIAVLLFQIDSWKVFVEDVNVFTAQTVFVIAIEWESIEVNEEPVSVEDLF